MVCQTVRFLGFGGGGGREPGMKPKFFGGALFTMAKLLPRRASMCKHTLEIAVDCDYYPARFALGKKSGALGLVKQKYFVEKT